MTPLYFAPLLALAVVGLAHATDEKPGGTPAIEVPKSVEDSANLIEALVKDSKRLEVQRPTDPASPLRRAEEYAAWLAGDVKEYADVMVSIIKRHSAAGNEVDALYLADRLPGSGSLQSCSMMALYLADEGKQEKSLAQQAQAERWLFQGSGQTLQKSLLNLLTAARITQQDDRITRHKAKLTEINLVELDMACIQRGLDKPQNCEEALKKMNGMDAKGVEEVKARYMMTQAEAHLAKGNQSEGEKCFDEAGKLASSNGLAHEYRVMLDLARLARKYKMTERSEKCLNVYLQACDRFPMGAEWRAPYVTAAVETLLDWGRKDQALTWLKSAREGASKVYIVDAAEAHISTARLIEKLEGPEAADAVVYSALRTGLLHPHPRAKGRASVQACLYYHDIGRALPESVLTLLQKARETYAPEPAPNQNGK